MYKVQIHALVDNVVNKKAVVMSYDRYSIAGSIYRSDIEKFREVITCVIFRTSSFSLESMLRWLMDRDFLCNDFREVGGYYEFNQLCKKNFNEFQYRKIDGEPIILELGISARKLKDL